MAKQRASLTALGQIQADTQSAYLSAPMIAVPNTQITDLYGNARQIRDPSKTLRPAIGIERFHTKAIILAQDEKGSNGEQVWKLSNGEDRVRFVGSFVQLSDSAGTRTQSGVANDYIEITFYGTGLNLLNYGNGASSQDIRPTVDGGVEGANINPGGTSTSAILTNRNYPANQIFPVTSGLSLGIHTVKLRAVNGVSSFGFEILNESSSIGIPKGEIISGGFKEVIGTAATTAYNSGFDGSPVLNGRGGRVVIYRQDGSTGKVLQQADGSQGNLSSADHSNEEVIRRFHWREFGANRADDFSTQGAGLDSNAFILEDGVTSLASSSSNITAATETMWPGTTNAFLLLTFVGTGLDIERVDSGTGTLDSHTISVDGASIGSITSAASTASRIEKIVSGLPYGTHTVKILRPSAVNNALGVVNFIVYGPKKPAIPDGATQIGEYYLMADFIANSTAGIETIATGVMRKQASREMLYIGGAWGANLFTTTAVGAWAFGTNTPTNAFQYTFWGTGFEHRAATNTAGSGQIDVLLNGVALTAANFGTAVFSTYGGFSFNSGTGALDGNNSTTNGSGFRVSGLPLAKYTVRFTMTGAGTPGMSAEALDIITPVHFPDMKRGSLALNPSIASFAKKLDVGNVDLSKAKAWLQYDTVTVSIINSYNISGVLQRATSDILIFFEKPFKTDPICVTSTSNNGASVAIRGIDDNNSGQTSKFSGVTMTTSAATNRFYIVFFGELHDEDSE